MVSFAFHFLHLSLQVDGSSGNCLYGIHQEVPGSSSLQEQGLPILPVLLLQIGGSWMVKHRQLVYQNKYSALTDVKLWPGGGDSTVQGSSVIQGLHEACVGERVLG